jgi:hypothetical protein
MARQHLTPEHPLTRIFSQFNYFNDANFIELMHRAMEVLASSFAKHVGWDHAMVLQIRTGIRNLFTHCTSSLDAAVTWYGGYLVSHGDLLEEFWSLQDMKGRIIELDSRLNSLKFWYGSELLRVSLLTYPSGFLSQRRTTLSLVTVPVKFKITKSEF